MTKPVTVVSPVPDTPFRRRMARGHELRLGHAMDALHVTADGVLWHSVKRCCGETVPAEVKTWEEEIA